MDIRLSVLRTNWQLSKWQSIYAMNEFYGLGWMPVVFYKTLAKITLSIMCCFSQNIRHNDIYYLQFRSGYCFYSHFTALFIFTQRISSELIWKLNQLKTDNILSKSTFFPHVKRAKSQLQPGFFLLNGIFSPFNRNLTPMQARKKSVIGRLSGK